MVSSEPRVDIDDELEEFPKAYYRDHSRLGPNEDGWVPPNGSYHGMSYQAVSQIYKRCYNVRMDQRSYVFWEDGIFFSRLDKFPYWIRDMLAYREAQRRRSYWTELANTFRYWTLVYSARAEEWIFEITDRVYLHEFPHNMRHLWNFHYGWQEGRACPQEPAW